MAKKKVVSSKTHSQAQLNDYANQHNPNNKAYQARKANEKAMRKKNKAQKELSEYYDCFPLDPMCYTNPYDMEF
ncbi:hypothetical protein SAMN02910265_01854 [Ruminococcus flavefaciens]|uniref:Uncharacterized protein n=1 Tax=Ruminococcus flavefaciens TaxID=1265 RepID=A0A1H6JVD1_RUMFL|nr:hypothetical protein [Ruminococcus flavefaciens]SEH63905.1 hypothetical protein SAMN02910265_01854 [Ruminococcus flavefaciens]